MIRQAHTYLAGAVSGTVLIAVAVVGFVMLVSVQTVKDWPLAGLVGGDDTARTSDAADEEEGGPAPPADRSGSASPGDANPVTSRNRAAAAGGRAALAGTGGAPAAGTGAEAIGSQPVGG